MMFAQTAGGKKNGTKWATEQLALNLEKRPRRFRPTKGFTGDFPRQLRVETALWVHAAKKAGK